MTTSPARPIGEPLAADGSPAASRDRSAGCHRFVVNRPYDPEVSRSDQHVPVVRVAIAVAVLLVSGLLTVLLPGAVGRRP